MEITLVDGSVQDLSTLDASALQELHWEQERAFANLIRRSPRSSDERAAAFSAGYDTVTKIIAQQQHDAASHAASGLVMGYNPRYARFVLKLLRRAAVRGVERPRLFEIGYGCGALLADVAQEGFDVAGVEVSGYMRLQALQALPNHGSALLVGDFLRLDLQSWQGCQVVYWNDVLEHIHPDESLDFVRRAYELLSPGGVLVTITPNWHTRPTDITKLYRPPRHAAEGFHLHEYTLREVTHLLRAAGFRRIGTPLFVTRQQTVLAGRGLAPLKRLCEPLLEMLPFPLARLICRGGALNTTLAWK